MLPQTGGFPERRAAALDKAIALDPADESNYLDGGMMLCSSIILWNSAQRGRQGAEVAPDSCRAHRLKALAEFKLGRINDAESLYAKAVALNPAAADAIAGLATAQLDRGDARQAEETLKGGIARLPRAAIHYQAYGNLLLSGIGTSGEADLSRAAQLFQKAVARDGSLADAHYGLGKIALLEDRVRDAQQELEAAVKLDPGSSKNHYALAQAYRKLGRARDAAREVERFQALKAAKNGFSPASRQARQMRLGQTTPCGIEAVREGARRSPSSRSQYDLTLIGLFWCIRAHTHVRNHKTGPVCRKGCHGRHRSALVQHRFIQSREPSRNHTVSAHQTLGRTAPGRFINQ